MKKTNAARILDNLKINYELHEYKVDENDLSAESVAEKIGVPLEQVFKTLVARGDKNGIVMACIPAGRALDLKALAVASGNKKVEMVALKEVQPLTGYIRGGVSPIGSKKNYPVFIDESVAGYSFISISAGTRGCQIFIHPQDVIKAVGANTYKLAADK